MNWLTIVAIAGVGWWLGLTSGIVLLRWKQARDRRFARVLDLLATQTSWDELVARHRAAFNMTDEHAAELWSRIVQSHPDADSLMIPVRREPRG